MNKLVLTSALLLAAASTQAANYQLVTSDNSDISKFCIAAAQSSHNSLSQVAASFGIASHELNTVHCNGMPVESFAAKYRAKLKLSQSTSAALTRFVFNKRDESPLTELCMAALASDETYQQLKQQQFNGDSNLDAELKCNGMQLDNFIRRYRASRTEFSAVSR
jgi:hypothetical protein